MKEAGMTDEKIIETLKRGTFTPAEAQKPQATAAEEQTDAALAPVSPGPGDASTLPDTVQGEPVAGEATPMPPPAPSASTPTPLPATGTPAPDAPVESPVPPTQVAETIEQDSPESMLPNRVKRQVNEALGEEADYSPVDETEGVPEPSGRFVPGPAEVDFVGDEEAQFRYDEAMRKGQKADA
jgi:hypothetical protein